MTDPRLPQDYRNRIYAGWLGKCIGVRFGAPLEGWTYQEIKDNLGDLDGYLPLPEGKIFKPDDDTAMPMILIRAIEDFGPNAGAAEMGETWLNYLGDQRATLWWGGFGVSTEHTAYLNLASGIPAPLSGSQDLNGLALAEQIGGQIFSDIWGLIAPGRPELAADYADRAASVAHDGNGRHGARFIAAMVSQAFVESDPVRLVQAALEQIPAQSEYARVVEAVMDYWSHHSDDWHSAYGFIRDNFGYDRYPGEVPIIPNAAIIVMSMLYGEGDFNHTIQICNMGGWDTDCNVGNVGAIMGVAVGLEGIHTTWRSPMNDVLVTAGIVGSRNLLDIPACADLFSDLAQIIHTGTADSPHPRYHFSYPGSTQGFVHKGNRGRVVALRQVEHDDGQGLQAIVRKLHKKGEVRLCARTYLQMSELSANYYGASFSPKIYPGQSVRARLFLPSDAPNRLRATLYVWDSNHNLGHQSEGQPLSPGQWHDLDFRTPILNNACLSEVGIVLRNLGDPWTGSLILDSLDWDGTPNYTCDFSLEHIEQGAISQWTFLRGYWRLQNGAFHGSGAAVSETYTGDIDWKNYTLTVRLTPLVGEFHNINVRVQGARRSYAIGLAPGGEVTLYKNHRGYCPVASAAFDWEHNRSYSLTLLAQGSRLQASINGLTLITWEDEDNPFLNGQIGLSNFSGCHTRYEELIIT